MIEVRITVLPGGDRTRARDLHVFTVENTTDGDPIADYVVRRGSVTEEIRHTKSEGVLALVDRAIAALRRRGWR